MFERPEEGGGTGEEALLEGHQHEVGGEPLGVFLAVGLTEFGIPFQSGVDELFFDRVIEFEGLEHGLGESGMPKIILGKLGLEATDHDRLFLAVELLGFRLHSPREPLVIQQLEQCREALRVAIVGGGRQEKLVLEVRGKGADRAGAKRVGSIFAPTGRERSCGPRRRSRRS